MELINFKDDLNEFFNSTVKEFPLTIASGVIASIVIIVQFQIARSSSSIDHILINTMVCAVLGIALFFAIEASEQLQSGFKYGIPAKIIILVFLGLYFIYLPEDWNIRFGIRTLVLLSSSHLLASFLPAIHKNDFVFWNYNVIIFRNILFGVLLVDWQPLSRLWTTCLVSLSKENYMHR